MAAQADRTSKRVRVFVPEECIEDVDALRVALGLKSRAAAVLQLIEDGLKVKGFGLSRAADFLSQLLALAQIRTEDTTRKGRFVAIPSAVSTHSWNLIFDPLKAAGFYSLDLQERFALDTRLDPSPA